MVLRRLTQAKHASRETIRIDPIGNGETHIGAVTHVSAVLLENRFSVVPNSLGAQQLNKILGGLEVTQVTIQVDEIATDPDAEDLMSYTFWCNSNLVPPLLAVGNVVSTDIKPTELVGIGLRWVAGSLKIML